MKNKELVMAKTHFPRKHKHHHRSSQADHYHWTHEIPSKGLIFITLAAFAIMIYGSYIIISNSYTLSSAYHQKHFNYNSHSLNGQFILAIGAVILSFPVYCFFKRK